MKKTIGYDLKTLYELEKSVKMTKTMGYVLKTLYELEKSVKMKKRWVTN
jgi:hypothetical protein